ncbi:MAG: hypothetical protein ISR48_06210 [Alphaproteobacteria bacterium]|nr:hypothetical protein [Alphaproteobacteria bacterium]
MPKTDVKRPESEDVSELSDEALDRTAGNVLASNGGGPSCNTAVCGCAPSE